MSRVRTLPTMGRTRIATFAGIVVLAIAKVAQANVFMSTQTLEPTPKVASGQFGSSLAMFEDGLVVGAPGFIGGAYVFYFRTTPSPGYVQFQQLSAPSQGLFGASVAMAKDLVVVGAPNETVNGTKEAGA